MFITKEQLEKRLNSERNLLNMVKDLGGSHIKIKKQGTRNTSREEKEELHEIKYPEAGPLPNESNKQRAARHARFAKLSSQSSTPSEYTVNPNISNDIVRSTIGILSSSKSASSKQIQKEFGVTKNQIVGAAKSKKGSIAKRIDKGCSQVSELAVNKLLDTLGLLDMEEIAAEKPKVIASIASDLSRVVSNINGSRTDKTRESGISFHIHSPEIKKVTDFKVIDV